MDVSVIEMIVLFGLLLTSGALAINVTYTIYVVTEAQRTIAFVPNDDSIQSMLDAAARLYTNIQKNLKWEVFQVSVLIIVGTLFTLTEFAIINVYLFPWSIILLWVYMLVRAIIMFNIRKLVTFNLSIIANSVMMAGKQRQLEQDKRVEGPNLNLDQTLVVNNSLTSINRDPMDQYELKNGTWVQRRYS